MSHFLQTFAAVVYRLDFYIWVTFENTMHSNYNIRLWVQGPARTMTLSDAYMRNLIGSYFVQVTGCHLLGIESMTEPNISYNQLGP